MLKFIQKQKQRTLIMIITMLMIILGGSAVTSLSLATGTTSIVANQDFVKVKPGELLTFSVTDDTGITKIWYEENRFSNDPSMANEMTFDNAKNYTLRFYAPNRLGLYEVCIAAQNQSGTKTKWSKYTYYVVGEDENIPSDYVDTTKPQFRCDIANNSEITENQPVTV